MESMRRVLLWLIVAAVLAIGVILYRSRPDYNLNVTPEAAREIQKAKRH